MVTRAAISAAVILLAVGLVVELHPRRRVPVAAVAAAVAPLTHAPLVTPAAVEEAWPYESLGVEERAVVDRNRDASTWEAVHRGFSEATVIASE